MIALYLKTVFSTRACRWYPDSFFHRRRPISFTLMIVRSRAQGRGLFLRVHEPEKKSTRLDQPRVQAQAHPHLLFTTFDLNQKFRVRSVSGRETRG